MDGAVSGGVGAMIGIGGAALGKGFAATVATGAFDGWLSGMLSRGVVNWLSGNSFFDGYNLQAFLTDTITGGVMSGVFHQVGRILQDLDSLGNFGYFDEMLNPSIGHEGYYNGEGPIAVKGIGAIGGPYATKKMPDSWLETDILMKVRYYDAEARAAMEVFVNSNGQLIDASGNVIGSRIMNTKVIAVMDKTGHIYYSDLSSGENIHHSSFLAGGDIAYAGQIEIRNGIVIQIDALSGHYTPEFPLYNDNLISELQARVVDISNIISIPGWR